MLTKCTVYRRELGLQRGLDEEYENTFLIHCPLESILYIVNLNEAGKLKSYS